MEGCPDSLYYLPPPSSGLSNYSDKSLKELTALPGKEETTGPAAQRLHPEHLLCQTCHPIVNSHHQNGYYTRKTESLSASSLFFLSTEEISRTFLRATTLSQNLSCFGFKSSPVLSRSPQQILNSEVDLDDHNYWLPIEILEHRAQTGHILPEAILLGPTIV